MNNDIFFNLPLDLGISSEKINQEKAIEFKQILSQFSKNIPNDQARICPICNRQVTSFCNSHSIPRFCLKQISDNGMIISPGFIFDSPLFESKTGIAKTGTFRLICEQCDHEKFSEYEQPQNYNTRPTPNMLAQIAMKSSLRSMYKRISEINIYQQMINTFPLNADFKYNYFKSALETSIRDYKDFNKDFLYAKKSLANSINLQYQIGYYQKLNYKIPIAAQIEVVPIIGLHNEIINNVFNKSVSYNLQPLHICLFPLEMDSIVILFFKNGHHGLRNFCKNINALPENEQLQLISYICFLYSEDIYMNETAQQSLKKYDKAKQVINTSSIGVGFSNNPSKVSHYNKIQSIKDAFNLTPYKTFPNLLSQEFKIIKSTDTSTN